MREWAGLRGMRWARTRRNETGGFEVNDPSDVSSVYQTIAESPEKHLPYELWVYYHYERIV